MTELRAGTARRIHVEPAALAAGQPGVVVHEGGRAVMYCERAEILGPSRVVQSGGHAHVETSAAIRVLP